MKRVGLCLLILVSVSCGDRVLEGTGSSYLVITQLTAGGGDDFQSDVITNGTIFADSASVTFALEAKDPGGPPLGPANQITVNRYRVRFIRSDGRNTEGVDVPYAFDGAFTRTVADTATVAFTLVRAQAKAEAPLGALVSNLLVISTIAEITFYGHDQTGREVLVTGQIGVHFANWAD
jgi:hypothetical protein